MSLAVRFHYMEFEFAPAFNGKNGGSQMRVKSRSASIAAVELPGSNQSHMGRGLQDYEKMLSCTRHLPRQE